MKKQKLPKIYRETPEERQKRVQEENGRFRSRIETPKTVYNRKRDKHNMRNTRGGEYHD